MQNPNFVGIEWQEKYGGFEVGDPDAFFFMPSMNQVLAGILKQVRKHVLETSGLEEGSSEFEEAVKNLTETWESQIFGWIPDIDMDAPITEEVIDDPDHEVSQFILWLYTIDAQYIYADLNKGSKEGDMAMIETLGAYAALFGRIIMHSAKKRKDIAELK